MRGGGALRIISSFIARQARLRKCGKAAEAEGLIRRAVEIDGHFRQVAADSAGELEPVPRAGRGQNDPPILDTNEFAAEAKKFSAYCAAHPNVSLLAAREIEGSRLRIVKVA